MSRQRTLYTVIVMLVTFSIYNGIITKAFSTVECVFAAEWEGLYLMSFGF